MPAGRNFLWMGAVVIIAASFLATNFVLNWWAGSPASKSRLDQNPAVSAIDYSRTIDVSPLFEEPVGWSAGYALATGHGPGAVVGPGSENPNVFAQTISVKGGEQLLVIARASSIDKPTALAMIQVNWLTAEGQFISVFQKSFEVTPDEKTVRQSVAVPPDAAIGSVYVVPGGTDDVVRYTEMRVIRP